MLQNWFCTTTRSHRLRSSRHRSASACLSTGARLSSSCRVPEPNARSDYGGGVGQLPPSLTPRNGRIHRPVIRGKANSDSVILKAHFDSPYPISGHSFYTGATNRKGLFVYPSLNSPVYMRRLADRTLVQSAAIVRRIVAAPQDPSGREMRRVVKNLDRLSDLLCGVIDMCELVRNVHPDKAWVQESERTYGILCSLLNELNTNRELYESLLGSVSRSYPDDPLSSSERRVAQMFLSDFERSGIHLPPAARQEYVKHSDSILSLGRSFLSSSNVLSSSSPVEIPNPQRLLAGLGSQFIESLPRKECDGPALVVPGSWEAHMIGRYAREGEARKLVYLGGVRKDMRKIRLLEQMLKERAKLANVLGKENWAEVTLADKMIKTPQNVMRFLTSLAQHQRPAARADVTMLQRAKATALTGNHFNPQNPRTRHLPPIHAWDKDHYSELFMSSLLPSGSLPSITAYFSVGTTISGLSQIFSKLYGISFEPATVAPGEVWHSSVRRLNVVDETGETIGVIYCDLFSRPGKTAGAAHYTVRCSRRVDDDDVDGDGLVDGWDLPYGPGLEADAQVLQGKEGRYQLPIVVLSMDCGTVEVENPALLRWNDLETLFHEMGHALHSMIGRTEFHNVSGTRCATDFVELPSILMEHFVSSPEVLSTFAAHYSTGEALPQQLIEEHIKTKQALSALEIQSQITMAVLDQKYHSLKHTDEGFDSTSTWHHIQKDIGVLDPPPGTAWQTQFGHLYGYGATYYSYLFDRAIAGKVWATLFSQSWPRVQSDSFDDGGVLNRRGGEEFKNKVLKWGGGKDPWDMVGDVVGGEEGEKVRMGDEKALAIVGGWMIG